MRAERASKPASSWWFRRSTRRARRWDQVLLVVTWLVWAFYVDHWLGTHGHANWTDLHGRHSKAAYLAWIMYVPAAAVLWLLLFPGDRSFLRLRRPPPPAPPPPRTELATVLAGLFSLVADRLPAPEQESIRALIDQGELEQALGRLALKLYDDDRPVSPEERRSLSWLGGHLELTDRAGIAVAFLARGLSGSR